MLAGVAVVLQCDRGGSVSSSLMTLADLRSLLAVGWRCPFLAMTLWVNTNYGNWLLSEQVCGERERLCPKQRCIMLSTDLGSDIQSADIHIPREGIALNQEAGIIGCHLRLPTIFPIVIFSVLSHYHTVLSGYLFKE